MIKEFFCGVSLIVCTVTVDRFVSFACDAGGVLTLMVKLHFDYVLRICNMCMHVVSR